MFREILLSPKEFFDELVNKPESLKYPALIVLVTGIITGISAALLAGASSDILPPEASFMSGVLPFIGFFVGLIGSFVMWVIWAAVMHIISIPLKGKGSFSRTLEITGYGIVPQIFGTVIATVLTYAHVSSLSLSPVSTSAEVEAATQLMSTGPLMTASAVVSVIFLLWSANVWIFGFIKCRRMEFKGAAIAVGIPILVDLVFVLTSVV
ncbi:hypothetical protein J2128_001479 [Methanomicrobium sp. W14]|uniref:YIP1 family protein n=1 Tax=Methanomicrobium sp. W14 TaxID=2817839 RepID=UPI001AE4E077|nr:YIP1 family protein [Methanomicrobium sp. W14]MBP2133525.1 hypothetical protein [Methanomicrobium sp. W14]